MNQEPTVIINGIELTDSQSLTMCIAIALFAVDLLDPCSLVIDSVDKETAALYKARTTEIIKLMF